ncbi:protein SRC2-like [Brachypodium distachyon]|uniref:C2 domain-containing protein n=1 Tax=Brachypodium distachyon TaxID=15368 RepID=I1GRA8_BRADI|nr:protein SRC2-like [Brachypodium distachyon]KQK14716.2 hypothetical protein BRADI_1g18260v3 [Brachypodium distachyon]|eukprot:XP_024313059.1 protein SRC2-like [Brachypodium distachyon]
MAHRVMELTLVSASDLKDVNTFSDMEVYAVATVSSDPTTRQRTRTDRWGGTDPSWDHHTHRFTVPPTAADAAVSGATLRVLLRTERFFSRDRDVGEVIVPLAELLDGAGGAATSSRCASFRVRKVNCGAEHRGKLRVSYRLGPIVVPLPMLPPGHDYSYGDGQYYHRPPPYYWQYYGYPPPSYSSGYPAPPSRYPVPYLGAPPPYARTPASGKKDGSSNYVGLLGGLQGGIPRGDMRMLSSSETTPPSAAAAAAHDAGNESTAAATAADGAGRAAADGARAATQKI